MSQPKIKACIFDMDGLLLDTETIYSKVSNKILEQYGKVFPIETKVKMMGRDNKTATNILLTDLQVPLTFEEYDSQATALKEIMFRDAVFMPGAERLIQHLVKNKIPIAVATSSAKKMFNIKTTNHQEQFALFKGHITCGDDPTVKHAKPAPDLFLTAMGRLGDLDPSDCLVFEDAENGVEAANRANMHSIWVQDMRFSVTPDTDKLNHNATERITSLLDFEPTKYGLPPYSE